MGLDDLFAPDGTSIAAFFSGAKLGQEGFRVDVDNARKVCVAKVANGQVPKVSTSYWGRVKAVLIDIERYNQMIDDLQDLEDARNPEIRQAAEEAREAREEDLVPLEGVLKRYGL